MSLHRLQVWLSGTLFTWVVVFSIDGKLDTAAWCFLACVALGLNGFRRSPA